MCSYFLSILWNLLVLKTQTISDDGLSCYCSQLGTWPVISQRQRGWPTKPTIPYQPYRPWAYNTIHDHYDQPWTMSIQYMTIMTTPHMSIQPWPVISQSGSPTHLRFQKQVRRGTWPVISQRQKGWPTINHDHTIHDHNGHTTHEWPYNLRIWGNIQKHTMENSQASTISWYFGPVVGH